MVDLADVYARHAVEFARSRRGSEMERQYLDEVVARCASGSRVLDLGCGSGEPIARYSTS